MSNQRAFEGVWIPAELWLDHSLSIQEKVMLVEVKSLSRKDPKRGCFKSNKKFAEFFNLSVSRVSEVIASLKKKGLLVVREKREGKQIIERNIFLSDLAWGVFGFSKGYSENTENPIRNPEGGYSENAKESNTSMSNTGRVLETLSDAPDVDPIEEEFASLWSTYPKRAGSNPKAGALKKYRTLRKQFSADEILAGVRRYAAFIRATDKENTEFVKQAQTFLGPDLHWQEEYRLPIAKGKTNENTQPSVSRLQREHNDINAAFARASAREAAAGAVEAHEPAVRPQVVLPARAYGRG